MVQAGHPCFVRFSLQCPPLECHLPPSRANIIPYSRCRQTALLFKCFHRRSTWSWVSPSSLFDLDLYPRLTGNPSQDVASSELTSRTPNAVGLHQALSVEPRPRAPRDPTSTVLTTPGHATISASGVPLASSIPASQHAALWRRYTFQVPTAVPHTHLPSPPHPSSASSQKPTCWHLVLRKPCPSACCPSIRKLSILPPWAHSQRKPRPSSRIPDRVCVVPTTFPTARFPEGAGVCTCERGSCSYASLAAQSVSFTNQEQHGPVHTSRHLSSQRCLCTLMAPLSGCMFGGIANASGMLRVPCARRRM